MSPTWIAIGVGLFVLAVAVKIAVLVGIAFGAAKAVPDEPSVDGVRVTRLCEPDAPRTDS